MHEQARATTGLTTLFATATVAAGVLWQQLEDPSPALWHCLALLAFLYGASLLILLPLLGRMASTKGRLQTEAAKAIQALDKARQEFQEEIERRTFEIAVVNADLNRQIAERIQAETESRALQHRLQLILDSAGLGIFGLDTRGQVEFVNRAALIMLGWSKEELLGRSHHELVHHTRPDGSVYPNEECPITMAYKDGKVHFSSSDVFWGKDGASFPVEYVSTPIREDNRLTGAVVTFRDQTIFA